MADDIYVAGQIERALAEDQRTHELGIRATVDGDAVVLRGEVACEDRRQLITEVAAETAPGLTIRNEVSVIAMLPPKEEAV
jgi:BON domain